MVDMVDAIGGHQTRLVVVGLIPNQRIPRFGLRFIQFLTFDRVDFFDVTLRWFPDMLVSAKLVYMLGAGSSECIARKTTFSIDSFDLAFMALFIFIFFFPVP